MFAAKRTISLNQLGLGGKKESTRTARRLILALLHVRALPFVKTATLRLHPAAWSLDVARDGSEAYREKMWIGRDRI